MWVKSTCSRQVRDHKVDSGADIWKGPLCFGLATYLAEEANL